MNRQQYHKALFVEKKELLLKKKQQEIDEMQYKIKKLSLQEKNSDVKNLIKQCRKAILNLKIEENIILNIEYLDRENSFKAIAYMVSKMENTLYHIEIIPIYLYYYFNHESNSFELIKIPYNLACLVKDGDEESAIIQIKDRFTIKPIYHKTYITEKDYYFPHKYLSIPSEYYVQLDYYKNTDQEFIYYNKFNLLEIGNYSCYKPFSHLCDEKFSYIIDYTDMLVDYCLDKPNLKISLEEMIMLADRFVKAYNDKKYKVLAK